MKRQEKIPLIRDIIDYFEGHKEVDVSEVIASVLTKIADGTPQDRMGMMQAALPFMAEGNVFAYPVIVDSSQLKKFTDFCKSKSLAPDVLISGAALIELGMVKPGSGPAKHF
jgi:hypothetical protein